MRLSKGVRYALRLLVDIAKNSDGTTRVTLSRVAEHTHMPRRYLEQLVIPLRKASLLKGTTGRGGGYVLGREPGDISIKEVVEVMVGPIDITKCILDKESCALSSGCECRLLYGLVNQRIDEVLGEYSIRDLVSDDWPQKALEKSSSI
jgi:Rrf2 family transcriptional regulator, cysteine metabolism repressor